MLAIQESISFTMDYKRRRIDPVQFILDLDVKDFRREWFWRLSDDNDCYARRNVPKQRDILHDKLLELQDVLYCTKPFPKSPQVFDHLDITVAPERTEP